ncbi:hypothetical protein QQS21_011790 [Conoideocrella luteorostrata]|uniref:Heterokaryon incompatibility domain-containing protein n=1 Tax=Conoideocrella luteorostrata TaxID=1105319 RepID=A0AAJ0CER3_9HYPO|nr:hypothetical protein QQS21_011790 [Conoideocrella luteorostrata]
MRSRSYAYKKSPKPNQVSKGCPRSLHHTMHADMPDLLFSFFRGKHQYSALPPGSVFRYFILKPGRGNDKLECSLRSDSLDNPPAYEAVSYVWGSPVRNQTILCDGRVLKITQSLSNVLKRLRLETEPRSLWADSICINQEDVKEKGNQVGLMARIYCSGKQALICLGDDDKGHAKAAAGLIQDINTRILNTCKKNDGPWALFPYLGQDDAAFSDTRWESIAVLCQCAWFCRGWVVQEAALAPKSLIMWGQCEINWAELMRVDAWANFRAPSCTQAYDVGTCGLHTHNYFFRNQNEARFFWEDEDSPVVRALNTLESARDLELTDPRDRIYAFLGLMSTHDDASDTALRLQPNYDQNFLDVYNDFAVEYIHKKRSVELLDYVQHNQETLDANLPSWIPRWDLRRRSKLFLPFWKALTDRDFFTHRPYITDATLSVRAVILDPIIYVSEMFSSDVTLDDIANVWKAVVQTSAATPYPPLGRLHAFIETLHGNPLLISAEGARRSQAAFLLQLHQRTGAEEAIDTQYWKTIAEGGDKTSYHSICRLSLDGKRMFLTRRGYFGHADFVSLDDQCGTIFGCKMPCVLRSAGRKKLYQLLGGAYIAGATPQIIREEFRGFELLGRAESKDWAADRTLYEDDITLC